MSTQSGLDHNVLGVRAWPWLGALLLLLILAVFGGWVWLRPPLPHRTTEVPTVPRTSLTLREGRWYQPPGTNLFTGLMVEFYPDGSLLSRSAVSNGLLNGVSEGWYTNGQIQIREYYKNSLADGLRQKWHENGQLRSDVMVVDGKLEGTFRSWHESGQLAEKIEMKRGQPDGEAWAFYSSGYVKAETQVREGKVLARKSWEDGEYRQANAAANGPLDSKEN